MAKGNNRVKQVRDVKGEEPKERNIQAVEGNTGTLTIALLNQILMELKAINGRLK